MIWSKWVTDAFLKIMDGIAFFVREYFIQTPLFLSINLLSMATLEALELGLFLGIRLNGTSETEETRLCCGLALPFRICLSNQSQVLLIQHGLLLLPLCPPTFLIFFSLPLPLFWLFIIVINNETLSNLVKHQSLTVARKRRDAYRTSSLLIVVVLFLLTRVI